MNPGNATVTPEKYLNLAEALSYRLSSPNPDPRGLLNVILGNIELPSVQRDVLAQGVKVALAGYGDKRRKMGPLAVIHPLRVAAIRCRIGIQPSVLELLSIFLHDKLEDLTPEAIGQEQYDRMQAEMNTLFGRITPGQRVFLSERLDHLTHKHSDGYNEYLANIMVRAEHDPDLLAAKLTDRLDNTLDVGVSMHGIPGQGAFGSIFDLLFLPNYPGLNAGTSHIPLTTDETRQILANLFKNAEFVNLLRTEGAVLTETAAALRDEVITASLRIARFLVQDTLILLTSDEQRVAVNTVLDYCRGGGLEAVYAPSKDYHPLDGLFVGTKTDRKDKIRNLGLDAETRARVGIVFIAVFAAFRSDPSYQIKGIDRHGVTAVQKGS